MPMTAKWLKSTLMATALLSASVSAHVHLASTVPSAESTISTTPETLSLTFSGEVKVIKLKLSDDNGRKVDFGFKPVVQAAKTMSWQLPSLPAGDYDVEWTVMGNDGHKMEDFFTFTVEAGHNHHAGH
ncbi:MAG: copper resistance protein CopC [Pseudomonadota bacterium]|nr:copper resistance protein CopC [Pseudomonadota bacterium]